MRLAVAMLMIIAIALSAACSSGQTSTDTSVAAELDTLSDAESRWEENEPSAYQYVIRRNCLACTPAVAGESALVRVDASGNSRVTPAIGGSEPSDLTISDTFDWLRGVIDGDFYVNREISYDAVYGFPSHARVEDVYGHGWTISVTDFDLLENG